MTKNLKNGQHIARKPKTGTEVPISRVVVFKPSAILKLRINRHSAPVALREELRCLGSTGIRSGRCFSAPFGS